MRPWLTRHRKILFGFAPLILIALAGLALAVDAPVAPQPQQPPGGNPRPVRETRAREFSFEQAMAIGDYAKLQKILDSYQNLFNSKITMSKTLADLARIAVEVRGAKPGKGNGIGQNANLIRASLIEQARASGGDSANLMLVDLNSPEEMLAQSWVYTLEAIELSASMNNISNAMIEMVLADKVK